MIRIIVADDHQLLREGIKKTLARECDIELVGEAWDSESLQFLLETHEVDIVLLDLSLSPPDELGTLRLLRERFPHVAVIVVSSHLESEFGVDSLREGASGYIAKSMTVDVIGRAVRKVYGGGRYVSESLADLLAHELVAPKKPLPHQRLTDRETQVLVLLATGLTVKQIAGKLGISNSSVNTYRARLFSKMALKTNAELIRYAIKHGLAS
jgi:DNA-binding NarL/FixJ family response regulator